MEAELYKMLVYDTGGFFLAHRDTEKTPGTFGTLVVVLPSAHCGGELVVRHAGGEISLDMSGAENSEICFAAFFADCEHEVRPITAGNPVCLVYNLIQKRERGALRAPDYEQQTVAAAALLEAYLSSPGSPAKLAWLLEHQYSPEGLSFAGLKTAADARLKVLAQAAERADCTAHLDMTLVTDTKGSPQTLVCTKNRRTYQRRCQQYRQDIAALKSLADQAHKMPVPNVSASERIETARLLAAKWSPE